MKIFLVGMPGSGKSTVGKLLAQKLALPFVDLDTDIERKEGKLVKEIFSEDGEDYFRTAESDALKQRASAKYDFVLATGGGAPCFHNGIEIINQSGLSIFLNTPIDEIVARVEKDTSRPLLLAADRDELKAKLEGILKNRLRYYEQAKIILPDSDIDTVLKKIQH